MWACPWSLTVMQMRSLVHSHVELPSKFLPTNVTLKHLWRQIRSTLRVLPRSARAVGGVRWRRRCRLRLRRCRRRRHGRGHRRRRIVQRCRHRQRRREDTAIQQRRRCDTEAVHTVSAIETVHAGETVQTNAIQMKGGSVRSDVVHELCGSGGSRYRIRNDRGGMLCGSGDGGRRREHATCGGGGVRHGDGAGGVGVRRRVVGGLNLRGGRYRRRILLHKAKNKAKAHAK